ncbi:ubiquinol-cytochrome c reductase iron-sulfur subunit N-terminal domain-containing protein [Microbacterium sp. bgisy189]|uniref:ubiquinol-cytochrome c reductase iron-sulfur subunit N-terminal domain-containing protein n=1 Tax=Microbacterium sp. bgisy189 TaxID=3413798 RepID=UPI003EB6B670
MTQRLIDELRPRVLRRVAPPEAPFAADLVAGEPPRMWVERKDFGPGPGWRAAADGHVLAPVDLALAGDGTAVILPVCTMRLDADAVATAGEAVTVAVSLLRGATEADGLAGDAGSWWVTADGRPVLALTGSVPWRPDTVALLHRLADAMPDIEPQLRRASDVIADARRLARDGAACEGDLFAAAEARPLAQRELREQHAPTPNRRRAREADRAPSTAGAPASGRWFDVFVDLELGERARELLARPRRAIRKRPASANGPESGAPAPSGSGSRRRVLLLATGAAAAVLAAGALWPSEGGATESMQPQRSAAAETPSPTASDPSLDDVGSVLVARLAACGDAVHCDVLEPTAKRPTAGAALVASAETTLVDEYGGVAVYRAEAPGHDTQIIVAVRTDDEWLVREVYDLADQPS